MQLLRIIDKQSKLFIRGDTGIYRQLKSEPQELPLEEKNRVDIDYLAVMTGVEL